MVTTTYGHGKLYDCDTTTDFTKTDDGNTSTFTIVNGDYWQLDVTVSGGNEETKVVNDVNIGISTTFYRLIYWRYKCSNSNIKAKIILEFNDASTQEVLADVNSTSWTVGSATPTTGKTLDHIRVYADHATGTVWYDFLLVPSFTFTLPNIGFNMDLDGPLKEALPGIPSRDTNPTQNLGTENMVLRLSCDLDQGTWKRATADGHPVVDSIDGEIFWEIWHDRSTEPWQWLTLGDGRAFKAGSCKPHEEWRNNGDGSTTHMMAVTFKEYSLGDKSGESHQERLGL